MNSTSGSRSSHSSHAAHTASHHASKTHASKTHAAKAHHAAAKQSAKAHAKHAHKAKDSFQGAVPGNVASWISQAQAELAKAGVPASKMDAKAIAAIIQHESGGNPNAVNRWDSNAKAGHPSIGVMQTIQPTFNKYALPGHGNIRNPVDNIIAGVRYSIDRYGSVSNVPGVRRMNQGGGYVGY